MARSIFASFHYEDSHRVQLVLKMGAIEGDSLVTAQQWESVQRQTNAAIERWIHEQMLRKSAVVVLVGSQTASSYWVDYEIKKAWRDKRPLVGIRIHGLKNLSGQTSRRGRDPFANVRLDNGLTLDSYVPLHDPVGFDSQAVYRSIATNLDSWIAGAVTR
ncbi:TIR domain-containing protein [Mycobacterium seoulense]|uniref:TIR domain-containing protein n=1 Tax=Mycobacterium seoulense TaxID=386911 RepID=UPI003CF0EAF5